MYSLRLPDGYTLDGTRGRKICFRTESHYECFERSKSPMWTYDSAFNTYFTGIVRSGRTEATLHEDGKIIDTAACELKLEPFSGASVASTARSDVRVVDAIMIFDEVELANMRFRVLDDTVDAFVVVESELTHSGKRKPLYFQRALQTFPKHLRDKIIHVVVPENDYHIETGTAPQAVPHVRKRTSENS